MEGSGTGYFAAATSTCDLDVLALVDHQVDRRSRLPRILGPIDCAGIVTRDACEATGLPIGIPVGPGANDQPVNALALGTVDGDAIVSLGTSGAVSARSLVPVVDPSGAVDGVADAAGAYMPVVPTLNATRVTEAFARLLGVDYGEAAPSRWRLLPAGDRPVLVPGSTESERRTGRTPGASSPECAPT